MRKDDGMDSALLHFDIVKKIAEQSAGITKAHRELQALIRPFAGIVRIKSNIAEDEKKLSE
jgi:hypothetical protein